MKEAVLSDHKGTRISELEWVRRRSDEHRRHVYEKQVAARAERCRELERELARSWKSRHAVSITRTVGKLVLHSLSPRPARPWVSEPAHDEAAWWRGIEEQSKAARPLPPIAR